MKFKSLAMLFIDQTMQVFEFQVITMKNNVTMTGVRFSRSGRRRVIQRCDLSVLLDSKGRQSDLVGDGA